MFQSAISSRDYDHFVEVCKQSEEQAHQLKIRYTNTDQEFLQEVIDAVWHGGEFPETPFFHNETFLQEQIIQGELKETLDRGHRLTGHFEK